MNTNSGLAQFIHQPAEADGPIIDFIKVRRYTMKNNYDVDKQLSSFTAFSYLAPKAFYTFITKN
jgi:hypothetical protein